MNEAIIREVREEDLDGLMQLYTQLHENPIPEKTQELSALWSEIVADKRHHIVVAQVDGALMSSCVCVVIPNLTRGQRPYALIENVVTAEKYRKKGLATACLNFAKTIAREANCYKIMLLTGAKEAETLRFYEQAGFNSKDKTAMIQWL